MMDVKIEKKDNNVVELEITVPAEEFKKGINKSYRKNIGKFNIPGFRKGKAPKELVEKMYGEGVFYEDAVNFAIDETYPKAIDENNVEPVDRPNIDIKDIGKDKDLVYTAKVTVKPEVELGEYKGIEVSKKEYPVTDDDIDKQIESMRQKNARLITKTDGTIAKGDIAVIDFEGSIDDEPFEGGKGTNYQLEIGSGSFIEGFEDQLIGKKADEKVDVHVKFPDDYQSKKLAGKEALFKVKINEVKYKELPQLDDEFAKDVSEFETLDELKADLRKKTKERNDLRANKEFEDAVVKKVVENAKVDIPSVMVDREINYIMDDIKYRLSYQGITLEQYASYLNTTVDKMKEEYKDIAHNKVKTALVLEKIGKAES
ncbi:MAG TPA: trigger factor, partial [Clostridiaceae bacterium]|nr:trigger factor [Clostridiaceae bacterium]